MEKRLGVEVLGGAGCEAERSEARGPYGVRLGRAGRRSVDERRAAILELFSGNAAVDQVALCFGVQPTIMEKCLEKWGTGQVLEDSYS